MRYEVEVGGRRRQVTIARSGDGFAVTLDGTAHHVDVARIHAHSLSLIVDGVSSAEISIAPDREPGRMTVQVGATAVPVALMNGRTRHGRASDRGGGAGPQRLLAPMPGKVVRVPVAVGDSVRTRQPVVVVEAMKMENELRAGRDGIVAEVHAREGMSVEAGALLIVIQ